MPFIATASDPHPTLALAAALAMALTLGACGGDDDGGGMRNAESAVRPPATFRGTLPCADCPGIRTTLELHVDGTMTLSRMYLEGEPDRDPVFTDEGRWTIDDEQRLVVTPTDGASTYFALDSIQLTALDGAGQPLPPGLPHVLWRTPAGPMGVLAATSWRFVEPTQVAEAGRRPVLAFSVDGQLSGNDGCNVLTGSWSATGEELSLGPIATTRMACPPPVATAAQAIQAALEATAGYVIDGTELHLLGPEGALVARLRPSPLEP